jgi:hypothetical protein
MGFAEPGGFTIRQPLIECHPRECSTTKIAEPWNTYGGVSAEDLGAIYDYLRTVPTVKNAVPASERP